MLTDWDADTLELALRIRTRHGIHVPTPGRCVYCDMGWPCGLFLLAQAAIRDLFRVDLGDRWPAEAPTAYQWEVVRQVRRTPGGAPGTPWPSPQRDAGPLPV